MCQDVCPFNAGTIPPGAPELAPGSDGGRPDLVRLLGLGAAQFRKWQRRTAMRRIHRAQLLRNVCVALGNVGTAAEGCHRSPARSTSRRRWCARAAWAIGEIGRRRHPDAAAEAARLRSARRDVETNPAVLDEL